MIAQRGRRHGAAGAGASGNKRRWSRWLCALPDIPAVAESGLAGFAVTGWNGVSAPGGTARNIVDALNKTIAEIMAQAGFQKKTSLQGYAPVGGSPAEFAAFIPSEIERWTTVINSAGVKGE